MALNAVVEVLTQPGATGNQTISLPSNFDPKAVIAWAVVGTADGSAASYAAGYGFGTYRGGAVQQRFASMRSLDAAGTSDCGRGQGKDALLVLMTNSANAGTRDLELQLVSMQTGATSQVVVNWTNLNTTASTRVFLLILGGSDITDALADDLRITTAGSTQDETVASGFGQPDLVFFTWAGNTWNTGVSITEANDAGPFGFGWGVKGQAGRCNAFMANDASGSSSMGMAQLTGSCFAEAEDSGAFDAVASLDTTVANWPTDGFRLAYLSTPGFDDDVCYLALKGNFQAADGDGTAPATGTTQALSTSFDPTAGVFLNFNQAPSSSIYASGASVGSMGVGATDGSQDAWAGWSEDDQAATMDSNQQQSTAFVIRDYTQAAALNAAANVVSMSAGMTLSWSSGGASGHGYQWLALGSAAATGFSLDAQPGAFALTGQAAGVPADRVVSASPGAYALTGALAGLGRAFFIAADPGAFALSGASMTPLAARVLGASPGAFAVVGDVAQLAASLLFSADPGAFAITGDAASTVAGRVVNAGPGSFALTGAPSGTLADRVLGATPASYAITGDAAAVLAARVLGASPGAYVITGDDADLVYTVGLGAFVLVANPGSFAVSGAAAAPVADRLMDAAPASYALTGAQAGTKADRVVVASPGVYAVTGANAAALAARFLGVAPGTFALTGAQAGNVVERVLLAGPGAFTVAGDDVAALATRHLGASPGALMVTGYPATPLAGRVIRAAPGVLTLTGVDASFVYVSVAGVLVSLSLAAVAKYGLDLEATSHELALSAAAAYSIDLEAEIA